MARRRDGRGRRLLAEAIARTNHEIREQRHPTLWYLYGYASTLALNGDRQAWIETLQRFVAATNGGFLGDWWYYSKSEPAFVPLRQDPRFQELVRKAREHVAAEQPDLDRMRAEGLVPDGTTGN